MTFLEQVGPLVASPDAPVVVYGAGEGSQDAVAAADKLRAAGHSHVQVFEGGLAEWEEAGLTFEGEGALPAPIVPDGRFLIDTTESVIRWTGRNPLNHHSGTVKLSSGEVVAHHGDLVSASFEIDMRSIANEDIPDPGANAMLIAHLQSEDFFDVPRHPTAQFVSGSAEPIVDCTDGTPNYRLRGTFTLRGVARPLEFPVLVAASEDGQRLTGQGLLDIDRTEYGSQYGSGKFFRFLGKHLVNDHIHLHVKIHASLVVGC